MKVELEDFRIWLATLVKRFFVIDMMFVFVTRSEIFFFLFRLDVNLIFLQFGPKDYAKVSKNT